MPYEHNKRMKSFLLRTIYPTAFLSISCLIVVAYQPKTCGSNKQIDTRTTTESLSRRYTQAEINYFLEIALGSEYGNFEPTIKKWTKNVKIKIIGSPTSEDIITLQAVVKEINNLIHNITLQVDISDSNMIIYFVPESKFAYYESHYSPVNYGFFWNLWENDAIYNSKIMISTVGVTQQERSHIIREEITQSLGLMQDSYSYRDSIFYQGWTDPTKYTEIDKALIEMLYRPEIHPGMTKTQILEVFKKINTNQPTSHCGSSNSQPALDFSVDSVCKKSEE